MWDLPVLHLLVLVIGQEKILVEAVIGGVTWGVVDDGRVPLRSSSGGRIHGKLLHGAFFQILLLPLGHVGLQG